MLYVPVSPAIGWSTPLVLAAGVAFLGALARSLAVPQRAVLPVRGLRQPAAEGDVLGSALLVVALGSLVWAFAAADPAHQVVADGWLLLPLAVVAAVCFVLRERRAHRPAQPPRAPRPPRALGTH